MGAAKVLVPLVLLGGGAAAVGVIIFKARKAKASPLEEKPQGPAVAPPSGVQDPVIDTYNRAMHTDTRDPDYLKQAADYLEANGRPIWAREVRQKRDSLMAATGAAMAQARQQVAQQAAVPAAELARGKAEWEAASGGAPTQADVDKMYEWAIKPDSVNEAAVQQAYQMVIAYDTSPNRQQKLAVLADKLAKIKGGTYGVKTGALALPQEAAVQVPATEEPDDILPSVPRVVVKAGGGEVPMPEPPEEPEDEEPEGKPLPPLPPPPSPAPPAAQTPGTGEVPELAKEETSAAADPNGTIALARALIAVEDEAGWKGKLKAMIKPWQKGVGLEDDGKFGPGSALKMAEEVGILPLIRYYPLGSPTKAAAVEKYRSQLYELAMRLDREGKKAHAAAIRQSAEHEKGQGWPKTPSPVSSDDRLAMVDNILTGIAGGAG